MSSKHFSIFTLLIALLFAVPARAETKVGTVDVNRVYKGYRKAKEAEAKINDAKKAAQKEFGERADAYKKTLDEVNRINTQLEAPALSAEARAGKAKARDEKIAELKNMEREITEFRQTRQRELQEEVQRMRVDIVNDVMKVVLAEVKARNFDLVFDASGPSLNGFSPILFSQASEDFTPAVIAALNKLPAASPTPRP
jgi:Skp family chaperone for outer membrane proteins